VGSRRRTLRSARRVKSGPGRDRDGRPRPGAAGPGNGEEGKGPAGELRGGRGLAGGPALPEGKAGRAGRGVVPGGDLVRVLAVAGGGGGRPGCRPAGRAGLPPGTAGIQPPLRPPRQVRPARGGLDSRPRATRRYGPAPARPVGGGPLGGPPAGRAPQGHGGERICHRPLPSCLLVFHPLQKSGFRGLFSPRSRNQVPQGRKHPLLPQRQAEGPAQARLPCRARAAARLRSPGPCGSACPTRHRGDRAGAELVTAGRAGYAPGWSFGVPDAYLRRSAP
jgi:hypothetical protein